MESKSPTLLEEMNDRTRAVFRQLVETYLETGDPVGSRTLSRTLPLKLSAASIRNVMADLEESGLLTSPHTSAGRVPSESGLRLFVDGLLEVGDLTRDEQSAIEARVAAHGRTYEAVMADAASALSGLSHCAGLLVSSKTQAPVRHIEFVETGPGKGLAILVTERGLVENRVVDLPPGLTASGLREASNYVNARLAGRTFEDARAEILQEIEAQRTQLDQLSNQVIESGLAVWAGEGSADLMDRTLIVKGQANLLENLQALDDLERVRTLFSDIESKQELLNLLNLAEAAEGVQIFIGSETRLFSLSGSSVIVAPYRDSTQKVVGVLGVIGPTRLNYARVIPMVDFTAKVVGSLLP